MNQAEVTAFLTAGRAILAPVLEPQGFIWVQGSFGRGSGGFYDCGEYARGDRRLELHFLYSLGLVAYHVGPLTLSHDDYMRHTGHRSDARYPNFSSDPLDAFRDLAYDLEHFCDDFIRGSGQTVALARDAAVARAKLSGLQKMDPA